MAKEIKLPQISEGVDSAEVAEVMVSAGDTISEGDSMIAVETDKASVEVPSTASGKIKEVKVKEGGEIKVGDVIIVLEEGDDDSDEEKEASTDEKDEDAEAEKEQANAEEDSDEDEGDVEEDTDKKEDDDSSGDEDAADGEEGSDEGKEKDDEEEDAGQDKEVKAQQEQPEDKKKEDEKEYSAVAASPSVRRLARELGVDIQSIKGSGEKGRINEGDVKAAKSGDNTKKQTPAAADLPDFSKWGSVERQKMSSIRKATAKSTSGSWTQIPHVTQFDQTDITDLEAYRKKMQEKATDVKITVTAILAKIVVSALQRFPTFNSSLDIANKEIILKHYYHIGIAVDTEKGLLVPVIKDADKKSIYEIAAEITALSEKARDQKLSPEEMQGGTFVISNLGGIGGTQFTPIVYHPQVAILGVSRAVIQPVYIDDAFQPRQILPLSLSYDHRVIDGAAGAKFLRWIGDAIEDPLKAILGS
ncbi:2-oxo acid dehydrogenase subunit E2 [Olivibacter sp. SDN3]|uniref:2-oxo acid dehydrogenase subunit E2 n=1 Tax=Olivibacter sp. SDN3 TaxID=2764720 RepID=UPI0016514011|nr:2-oxo acid dehydrogenase subunit E2 [Olivibacter sp. SDN3]QNL49638.1 2-oxo acid dehydrogenase subunit E2 [Olivibacter sp. SDN3]